MRWSVAHGKSSTRRKVIILCGAAICLTYTTVILWMFMQRPVTSEDDERLEEGISRGRRLEWTPPYALREAERVASLTRDRLLSYYRLRLLVPIVMAVTRDCVPAPGHPGPTTLCATKPQTPFVVADVAPVLVSLLGANYEGRQMPIDVDLVVFVKDDTWSSEGDSEAAPDVGSIATFLHEGLRQFPWQQGRVSVQHGGPVANSSIPARFFTKSWLPASEWEMGLFLESDAALSPYWFQWWQRAFRAYMYPRTQAGADDTLVLPTQSAPPAQVALRPWSSATADLAAAGATPRGVVVHPFNEQPLACVMLPQTVGRDHTTSEPVLSTTTFVTTTVKHLTGVVWSAVTWSRFFSWSAARAAPFHTVSDVEEGLRDFMKQSKEAGRCVNGLLKDASALYRHPTTLPHVARLLGAWGPNVNLSKDVFERDMCVFHELDIVSFSSA